MRGPHMEFYKDTPLTLQDMSAPEFGGVDVLEKIIPVAKETRRPRVSIFTRRQFAARRREKLGIALRGGSSRPPHDGSSRRPVL